MDAFAELHLITRLPSFFNSFILEYNNFRRNAVVSSSSIAIAFVNKLIHEINFNIFARASEDEGLADCGSWVLFALVSDNKFTTNVLKHSVSVYDIPGDDFKLVISFEKNLPEMGWLKQEIERIYSIDELLVLQIVQVA